MPLMPCANIGMKTRFMKTNEHQKCTRPQNSFIFRPVIFRKYEDGKILVGVFGIITKSSKRMFQETKESLSVSLFNGHEYTAEMKMWPGPDGKLDRAKTAQMDELSTGLAVIRPKFWNLRPTATLITWDRVWEIV